MSETELSDRQRSANAVRFTRCLRVTVFNEYNKKRVDAKVGCDPTQLNNTISAGFKSRLEDHLGKPLEDDLKLIVGDDLAPVTVADANHGCDIVLGKQGLEKTPRPNTYTLLQRYKLA